MKYYEHQNNFKKFCDEMYKEQNNALSKFPDNKHLLGALVEEVGEAAQALLKITENNESPQNVYNELVQVAATAYRLATLGDLEYKYKGTKCHYNGCKQPAIGGPCPLCYE